MTSPAKPNARTNGCLVAVFIGLMAFGLFMLIGKLPSPPPSAAEKQADAIYAAHDAVRGRLKDPDSAKFSAEFVTGSTVCGYVNARNGFGGYNGPEPYIYLPPLVILPGDFQKRTSFAEQWRKTCAQPTE